MKKTIIKLQPGDVVTVDKDKVTIEAQENTTAENSDVNESNICDTDQSDKSVSIIRVDIETNIDELRNKADLCISSVMKLKESLIDLNEYSFNANVNNIVQSSLASTKENTTTENSDVKRKPSRTTVVQCGKLIELD